MHLNLPKKGLQAASHKNLIQCFKPGIHPQLGLSAPNLQLADSWRLLLLPDWFRSCCVVMAGRFLAVVIAARLVQVLLYSYGWQIGPALVVFMASRLTKVSL